jgi:HK97 family phage prohead protease
MTVSTVTLHRREVALEARQEGLPEGIAGRITGVALTYEQVDTYGTVFARGCAKRTIDTKVKARRVPFLMDHEREVEAHVGVVASLTDTGDGLVMVADLFDTEAGREARDYVKAVMAAGAVTGLSIGFVPKRTEMVTVDGQMVERFLEIELREISLTPMPAVPGTDVLGARSTRTTDTIAVPEQPREPVRTDRDLLMLAARTALDALSVTDRQAVLDAYASPYLDDAAPGTRSDCCAPPTPPPAHADAGVSMADRIAAVRRTYTI